jgi:hypothetical protein
LWTICLSWPQAPLPPISASVARISTWLPSVFILSLPGISHFLKESWFLLVENGT